jgi:lipopolysaccharide export system protein LptA
MEGEYFFKQAKADFRINVKLVDSSSTLTSQKLIYLRHENKAIAFQRVKIVEKENTIYSDSLIHLRADKISYAYRNTLLHNSKDGLFIFGNHLEDYRAKQYSLVDKDPLLVQFDTTYNDKKDSVLRIDTLIIKSLKMEAYRDSSNRFIAIDSVKIYRGDFSSVNDFSFYNRKNGYIDTWRISDSTRIPTLWDGPSQMTGDSIRIYLNDNKISNVSVRQNALLISQNVKYPKRYDQVSGDSVRLFFDSNQLVKTEVFGNALSYYYFYDDEEPNGIIKASARKIFIFFKDKKVMDVKMYGDPKNEYHPENLVLDKEKTFSLPGFILFNDRPKKDALLEQQHIDYLKQLITPYPKYKQ